MPASPHPFSYTKRQDRERQVKAIGHRPQEAFLPQMNADARRKIMMILLFNFGTFGTRAPHHARGWFCACWGESYGDCGSSADPMTRRADDPIVMTCKVAAKR